MALKTTAVLGTPKRLNKHQPVIFLFVEAALREQVGALAPLPRRETYTENISGAVFFSSADSRTLSPSVLIA
jgi:hypothetical protein